ncbi:hypothetical protein AB0D91_05270 [Streptomyces canus]|uniref:hypothetical protein n=1 Tax=Streptomyces canus TaxID=58343 RepID=UPI0033C7A914
MSETPDEEPEPLTIEIKIDATRAIHALENAHPRLFFMTHPDLNSAGPVRPDEETA